MLPVDILGAGEAVMVAFKVYLNYCQLSKSPSPFIENAVGKFFELYLNLCCIHS